MPGQCFGHGGVGQGGVQTAEHRRAVTDVRHKMAVHNINVQKIDTLVQQVGAITLKVGKVRRQN